MFDIGFLELLLIGTVALLVLGPERLPRAARTLGLWLRRARAAWYSMRAEMEREFADDELRRSLATTRAELEDAKRALGETGRELAARGAELGEGLRGVEQALTEPQRDAERFAGGESAAAAAEAGKPPA